MTAEEVAREVERAFSDVQYPGDDSIVERPSDWEASGIRSDFLRKHWRDVIEPEFLRAHNLFCFFSAKGLQFYLPAYLIGLVRFPEEGVHWSSEVLHARYPPTSHGIDSVRRWDLHMRALSASQKHAVRLVLEYLLETQPDWWWTNEVPGNELELALANYWGQF